MPLNQTKLECSFDINTNLNLHQEVYQSISYWRIRYQNYRQVRDPTNQMMITQCMSVVYLIKVIFPEGVGIKSQISLCIKARTDSKETMNSKAMNLLSGGKKQSSWYNV